jgi:hypothetical protein
MKLTGENRRTRGKTCPIATLSATNPTWTDPGSNPNLRGGRPAANRVSHGTAPACWLSIGTTFKLISFVTDLSQRNDRSNRKELQVLLPAGGSTVRYSHARYTNHLYFHCLARKGNACA